LGQATVDRSVRLRRGLEASLPRLAAKGPRTSWRVRRVSNGEKL